MGVSFFQFFYKKSNSSPTCRSRRLLTIFLLKISSTEIVFSNLDFSYIYNICFSSSLVISSSIYPKSSHKISILFRFFTANPYSTITSTTSSTVNLEKYSPISIVSNFSLTSSLVYFTSFKRFSISLKSSFFPKKSP